jgi:hypothetical protein
MMVNRAGPPFGWTLAYAVAACLTNLSAAPADPRPQTNSAFDRYIRATEARLDDERRGAAPFLWLDTLPAGARRDVEESLQRGQVVVRRVETRDGNQTFEIPGGLRHDWVGTVFVPHATLDRSIALMQDYDRYPQVYRPAVRRSHLVSRGGEHFTVSLQLFMKQVIGVVLNTDNSVQYVRVSPTRMQVRSVSTRIAEVDDADTPGEHEKPAGHDNGFLWRFNNYCALEERGGGTYVQCETVSLSRTIPPGLGWLIGPIVSSVPQQSLQFTLSAMRAALTTQ